MIARTAVLCRRPQAFLFATSDSRCCRPAGCFFSSKSTKEDTQKGEKKTQKMWIAEKHYKNKAIVTTWEKAVHDNPQNRLDEKLNKIKHWEEQGVCMQRRQQGVIHMNPAKDVDQMVKDYSVLKLAGALRSRRGCLQLYADLLEKREIGECRRLLKLYSKESVLKRRSLRSVSDALSLPPLLEVSIASHMGVHAMDGELDIEFVIEHYSGVALANGVRDLEETLQLAANLAADGKLDELWQLLKPHTKTSVLAKRNNKSGKIDYTHPIGEGECDSTRRELRNIPRRLGVNHQQRSAVMLALCNVHGVPSLLFTLRSEDVNQWPYEVCFPGGKMDSSDNNMFDTAKREASEEVHGIFTNGYNMLGALRCNWGKIKSLAQNEMAVTPVVVFVGEMGDAKLCPSKSEVAEAFTIPLETLMDEDL